MTDLVEQSVQNQLNDISTRLHGTLKKSVEQVQVPLDDKQDDKAMSVAERKELHTEISRQVLQLHTSIKDVTYEIERIDKKRAKEYQDELNQLKQQLDTLEQEANTLKQNIHQDYVIQDLEKQLQQIERRDSSSHLPVSEEPSRHSDKSRRQSEQLTADEEKKLRSNTLYKKYFETDETDRLVYNKAQQQKKRCEQTCHHCCCHQLRRLFCDWITGGLCLLMILALVFFIICFRLK